MTNLAASLSYHSFGVPALEAMAAGTHVVAAERASLP
jgi:glycosyltransferase involved in cell wall biosynthesis